MRVSGAHRTCKSRSFVRQSMCGGKGREIVRRRLLTVGRRRYRPYLRTSSYDSGAVQVAWGHGRVPLPAITCAPIHPPTQAPQIPRSCVQLGVIWAGKSASGLSSVQLAQVMREIPTSSSSSWCPRLLFGCSCCCCCCCCPLLVVVIGVGVGPKAPGIYWRDWVEIDGRRAQQ